MGQSRGNKAVCQSLIIPFCVGDFLVKAASVVMPCKATVATAVFFVFGDSSSCLPHLFFPPVCCPRILLNEIFFQGQNSVIRINLCQPKWIDYLLKNAMNWLNLDYIKIVVILVAPLLYPCTNKLEVCINCTFFFWLCCHHFPLTCVCCLNCESLEQWLSSLLVESDLNIDSTINILLLFSC